MPNVQLDMTPRRPFLRNRNARFAFLSCSDPRSSRKCRKPLRRSLSQRRRSRATCRTLSTCDYQLWIIAILRFIRRVFVGAQRTLFRLSKNSFCPLYVCVCSLMYFKKSLLSVLFQRNLHFPSANQSYTCSRYVWLLRDPGRLVYRSGWARRPYLPLILPGVSTHHMLVCCNIIYNSHKTSVLLDTDYKCRSTLLLKNIYPKFLCKRVR